MGHFIRAVEFLVMIFPSVLKAFKAWEQYKGEKMPRDSRKVMASEFSEAVKDAAEKKDTSRLEALLGARPVDLEGKQ